MGDENNRKFVYVKKGEGIKGVLNRSGQGQLQPLPVGQSPELGKLRTQLRSQVDPVVENVGNQLENRMLRIRQRLQNVGVGMQPQQKEVDSKELPRCPNCGNPLEPTHQYCPMCRAPLTVEAKRELEHKEGLRRDYNMSVLIDT